jgi:hypothetical protein
MGRGKTSKSHDWKTIFKLKNLLRARKRKWLSKISKIVKGYQKGGANVP